MMVNKKRFIFVVCGCILAFSMFAFARKQPAPFSGSYPERVEPSFSVGFTLKDVAGNVVRLSDYEGKIVIVNFWATWCPPCIKEIPGLNSTYQKYKDKGVVVVGVSLDERVRDVNRFIKEYGVTYPMLMSTRKILRDYGGVMSIPTTFILDQNHVVVERVRGYESPRYFEYHIQRLLKQSE